MCLHLCFVSLGPCQEYLFAGWIFLPWSSCWLPVHHSLVPEMRRVSLCLSCQLCSIAAVLGTPQAVLVCTHFLSRCVLLDAPFRMVVLSVSGAQGTGGKGGRRQLVQIQSPLAAWCPGPAHLLCSVPSLCFRFNYSLPAASASRGG